jgi:tRNA A-37 threonylcarbamoyl transferase component Bud32
MSDQAPLPVRSAPGRVDQTAEVLADSRAPLALSVTNEETLLQLSRELKPLDLVAEVRADQERHWRRGIPIPAENYCARFPALRDDAEAVLQLVCSEYLLRRRLGQRPPLEEYLGRFPHLGAALQRQLALEEVLADESGGTQVSSTSSWAPRTAPGQPAPLPVRIGKYRVVEQLGAGGQATVYRAVHPTLGQDVALKISKRKVVASGMDRDRLVNEGRILAQLDHPNLARVYDLDVHDGRPYLVLEYVRGQNLEQVARAGMSPRSAAELVARAARAVAAAHSKGVVHLDVKPLNILIDRAGQPRLIDFGLARLRRGWEEAEQDERAAGSVQYMAPEQARGEVDQVGARCDVFALGGVLYFLLVGHPPFTGKTVNEVLQRCRRCAWDHAALEAALAPEELKAVCRRALAAEPAQRYARADEMAADLEACVRPWWPHRWLLAGLAWGALAATYLFWAVVWPRPPVEAPSAPESRPLLSVRVWSKDRYQDLTTVAPLAPGAPLRVCVDAPPGLHVSLFLFTSAGRLERLAAWPPGQRPERGWCYPEGQDRAVPLTGPAGTEVLLACGQRSGPVDRATLERLWGESGCWPALPASSVLRLHHQGVVVEQRGRGLGPPLEQSDPEGEVVRRLERLRLRLRGQFAYYEGLAFANPGPRGRPRANRFRVPERGMMSLGK